MTNQEAIEILKCMLPKPIRADDKSTLHLMQTQALEKGIEALENQSDAEIITLYKGMSESMQKSVKEVMKVTQIKKEEQN